MSPIRGGRGKGTGASTIHAQGGHRWYFYVYALLGTHCARQVILLTACVFAQRVRRSRHSFWNHPRRAQSGLQDISRTLLRVDLICRHDVSGGGNFSHQVSIRGWSSCVRWEGKQTETRGVHTLFARRLGHNHDFGCSLPAVRWPLVLNTFYILHNSPQHPCPAHSDTLRTLTTQSTLRPVLPRRVRPPRCSVGAGWAAAGSRSVASSQYTHHDISIAELLSSLPNLVAWPVPAAQCRSVV